MDADYPVCTHPDETVSTDGWCECGTDLREEEGNAMTWNVVFVTWTDEECTIEGYESFTAAQSQMELFQSEGYKSWLECQS